jgi:hypothetical protein
MSASRPTESFQSGIHTRTRVARTLGAIVAHARYGDSVKKSDLNFGDRVIVTTRNSVYTLCTLGGDTFVVSGGWFDHNGETPTTVTVNGCTYGGSMIRQDVVAARGLFLEFGNNVSTTRIEGVRVVRWNAAAADGPALPC